MQDCRGSFCCAVVLLRAVCNAQQDQPCQEKHCHEPNGDVMVPPANLTQAITAEPKNDAPLQKISYSPKYSPEFSAGMILEK